MTPRSLAASLAAVGVAASSFTLLAVRARAAGVPEADGLTYTAYLENPDGTPVNATKGIAVSLYAAESGGKEVCGVKPADIKPVFGRFQIALPSDCTAAVKANPDLWVEVQIEGSVLPRTKLGAVPYALEAGRASDSAGELEKRLTALESASLTSSGFRAHKTSAQTVLGSLEPVIFNIEQYDFASEYDDKTGLFVSNSGGYYDLRCTLAWSVTGPGTVTYWEADLLINGERVAMSGGQSDGFYVSRHVSTLIHLDPGSKVSCAAAQLSGISQPLHVNGTFTSFQALRVAP